jgi:SAM-dependent methyltransferase
LFGPLVVKLRKMHADDHWQRVYEAKRPEEVSWYQPVPEPSLDALDRLGIGPEASLIDVGGGASALAGELAERGWRDVTVLDIAASAIAAAKDEPGHDGGPVRWIEADILGWRPDRTYDIWHDRALFHFLTEPAQRAHYVRALTAATHAGSLAIIATFALDGPEQCSGLPVQRHDAETLRAALGEGFSPVEAWRQAHVTPWGATQSFQWCVFRRVQEAIANPAN